MGGSFGKPAVRITTAVCCSILAAIRELLQSMKSRNKRAPPAARSVGQPRREEKGGSNTRYETGHRLVFAQIQQCVLANPVKPDAAAGISIPHTHRHQADRQSMAGREVEASRDDVTGKDGRAGAQPVSGAVFTGDREVGAGNIVRREIVPAKFLSAGL